MMQNMQKCLEWCFGKSFGSVGKELACNVEGTGEAGSVPGSGRSPGEGNGNPLQYPCLKHLMDRGAWWATFKGSQRVRHN